MNNRHPHFPRAPGPPAAMILFEDSLPPPKVPRPRTFGSTARATANTIDTMECRAKELESHGFAPQFAPAARRSERRPASSVPPAAGGTDRPELPGDRRDRARY